MRCVLLSEIFQNSFRQEDWRTANAMRVHAEIIRLSFALHFFFCAGREGWVGVGVTHRVVGTCLHLQTHKYLKRLSLNRIIVRF